MHTNVTAGKELSDEDAALLIEAHLDLVAAQASGTRVLGSTAGSELLDAAQAKFTARHRVRLCAGQDVHVWLTDPDIFVATPAASQNEVPA